MSIKSGKSGKICLSLAIDFFAPISRRVIDNLLMVNNFSFSGVVENHSDGVIFVGLADRSSQPPGCSGAPDCVLLEISRQE